MRLIATGANNFMCLVSKTARKRKHILSDEEALLRFSSWKRWGDYIRLFDIRSKLIFSFIALSNKQHIRGKGLSRIDISRMQSGEITNMALDEDIEKVRRCALILMKYRKQLRSYNIDYPAILFDVSCKNNEKQQV